jgi:Fe-S-cluster containining protein
MTRGLAWLQDPRPSGRARRRPRMTRGPPREDVSEMGEAKRRQAAAVSTTQYYDLGADELRPAKVGGDPEVLIRRMARREFPPVPCNGCVECCYHTRVEVDPDLERPEDLAWLATEPDPEGGLRLRKRPDGACIHLGSRGCTIYEHRPLACRRYDCRVFALFGVSDAYSGDHHAPAWAFQPCTPRGAALLQAYQMAGMWAMAKFKRENREWTSHELLDAAAEKLPGLLDAFIALSKLSPEEWVEITGVNLANVTGQQVIEAHKVLARTFGLASAG